MGGRSKDGGQDDARNARGKRMENEQGPEGNRTGKKAQAKPKPR